MIRVLRVLEYEYDSIERALEDMERWSHSSPGGKRSGMRMSSATVSMTVIESTGIDSSAADPLMRLRRHPFEGEANETVGGGQCVCGLQRNDSLHDDPREGSDG